MKFGQPDLSIGLVEHPSMAESGAKCGSCRAPGPAHSCGSCRCIRYCGRACQRAHWAKHKATCKALSAHKASCEVALSVVEPAYWMDKVPEKCDMCEARITEVFYDAATTTGMWANMCPFCFTFGPGAGVLGAGAGQKYEKQASGEFLATNGLQCRLCAGEF